MTKQRDMNLSLCARAPDRRRDTLDFGVRERLKLGAQVSERAHNTVRDERWRLID